MDEKLKRGESIRSTNTLERRSFVALAAGSALAGAALLANGCTLGRSTPIASVSSDTVSLALPAPDPDPGSPFGVDRNINMVTIDQYLNLPGIAYRDARLLQDSAEYEQIGGHADLEMTLEGFRIVPFPYVGTLQPLPVPGAYTGDCLFDIEWNEDGTVATASPRYEESMQILEDLFPRDRPVMIMCGAGGYAGMTRQLLIALGWDAGRLYNIGGQWDYTGYRPVQLISYDAAGTAHHLFWRADYASINFDDLTPLAPATSR